MASLRFLLAPAFVCYVGACSVNPETASDSASAQPDAGAIGGAGGAGPRNVAGSKNGASTGAAGRTSVTGGANTADEGADTAEQSSAGEGPTDPPPLHPSCDLNGSCSAKCEDTSVTCGVVSTGIACEFEGFTGATAQVACGQRVVIGTACCGGCGCVPVEVYFDGAQCWQGIPKCTMPSFTDRLWDPHPTSTPNTSFVPPSSFYLGSGGFGGNAGLAGGESGGADSAGADGGGTSGAGLGGAGGGGTHAAGAAGAGGSGAGAGGGAPHAAGAPSAPQGGGGAAQ